MSGMNTTETYNQLLKSIREIAHFGAARSLLSWDQETYMPSRGAASRAEQLAAMSGLIHERITSDSIRKLLDDLGSDSELGPEAVTNIRETRKQHDRATRVPRDLVTEMARTSSLASEAWKKARAEEDFESFSPWLEKTFELKRRYADCIGYQTEAYDALLDEFEPGASGEWISSLFDPLREALGPLVASIAESDVTPLDLTQFTYNIETQKELSRAILKAIGFEFEAGRLDIAAHPFCSGINVDDVRLTSRYEENDFTGALYSAMHEGGHGLYEQGFNPDHAYTPMASSISLGVHESQSRFWENMIGRSQPFCHLLYPELQKRFPEACQHFDIESLYKAINKVEPSFIRVESDEITYNLHVILRFEIEREVLAGHLPVLKIPDAWNEKMESALGILPSKPSLGALQDVHWSFGLIGYFPTYTLGNIYSAHLNQALRNDHPQLDEEIQKGSFATPLEWMRENIYRHGMRYKPVELIERACGQSISPTPLVEYLKNKFEPLYQK